MSERVVSLHIHSIIFGTARNDKKKRVKGI